MTQAVLGGAIGKSTAFVGHIERGTRVPSLETFAAICRVLGVPMDSVLRE